MLTELTSAIETVRTSPNDPSSIPDFVNAISEIPTFLTQSRDDYLPKLQQLESIGFFEILNQILPQVIDSDSQLKILKCWDILVSTSSTREEIAFLFQDGIAKYLVEFPWNVSSRDLLRCYVTVLKGIALKLDFLSVADLFSRNTNSIPLYSNAVQFIVINDSITISAARFIVLKLCMSGRPELLEYISEHSPKSAFEKLIDSSDGDRFAFLSDLVEVAPKGLVTQILRMIRHKISTSGSDTVLLAQVASAMFEGRGRSLVADEISRRLPVLRLSDPLSLGLLFFALSHKLIYLDAAIRTGLIRQELVPKIPRFSQTVAPFQTGHYLEEITALFHQATSVTHTALILRIFEVLLPGPPKWIFDLRREIANLILRDPTRPLMEDFSSPPDFAARIDLEYLCTHEPKVIDPSDIASRVEQLSEIESALARWQNTVFPGFTFSGVDCKEEVFLTQDQTQVRINGEKLIAGDDRQIALWECFLCRSERKSKRTVALAVMRRPRRPRTVPGTDATANQIVFTFGQAQVAAAFQARLIANQYAVVRQTLTSLQSDIG
jgi:hypothetical protein